LIVGKYNGKVVYKSQLEDFGYYFDKNDQRRNISMKYVIKDEKIGN